MERELERLGKVLVLTEDEVDGQFVIDDEAWKSKNASSDLLLVGRLLTTRAFNFPSFCSVMKTVMQPKRGLDIRRIGEDRLLFQFYHAVDKRRALTGGPWSFDKQLLILANVDVNENPLHVKLDHCSFHVRIYDLPLIRQTREMARAIGNRLGEFEDIDPHESWGASMRIRVKLDVSKPLKRCLQIKSSSGDELLISFTYEKLPNFCYSCGRLGHIFTECEQLYEANNTGENTSEMPYGNWLRELGNRPYNRSSPSSSRGSPSRRETTSRSASTARNSVPTQAANQDNSDTSQFRGNKGDLISETESLSASPTQLISRLEIPITIRPEPMTEPFNLHPDPIVKETRLDVRADTSHSTSPSRIRGRVSSRGRRGRPHGSGIKIRERDMDTDGQQVSGKRKRDHTGDHLESVSQKRIARDADVDLTAVAASQSRRGQ